MSRKFYVKFARNEKLVRVTVVSIKTGLHWSIEWKNLNAFTHTSTASFAMRRRILLTCARVCVSVVQNLNRPKNVRFLGCVCVCVCLPWPTTTRRRTPGYLDVCVVECVGNTNVLGVFLKWRNWFFFFCFSVHFLRFKFRIFVQYYIPFFPDSERHAMVNGCVCVCLCGLLRSLFLHFNL